MMPTAPEKRRLLTTPKQPTTQPDVFGSAGVAHHQIDRAHMEAEWRDRPLRFGQIVSIAERQVRNMIAARSQQSRPALGICQRNSQFVDSPLAGFIGDRYECATILTEA